MDNFGIHLVTDIYFILDWMFWCWSLMKCQLFPQPPTPKQFSIKASDMVSTSRILVAVVQMCYAAKDWDALNENIMLLSKRRSQLKQVRHYFSISLFLPVSHSIMFFFPKVFKIILRHGFVLTMLIKLILKTLMCCAFSLIRLLQKWSKNVTNMSILWLIWPSSCG